MTRPRQLAFDFIAERERRAAEVRGRVTRIIYTNPETHWQVVELAEAGTDEPRKLAGYLPDVIAGDTLAARGTHQPHPRFGPCLQVDEFVRETPVSRAAVGKYLVASLDGIGPLLAERIVAAFGESAPAVIEREPERLRQIEGIGDRQLEKIRASSGRVDSAVRELMLIGFSEKWAGRLFLKYGDDAARRVKENPYRLIRDCKGIGFKKADVIARQLGIDPVSEYRLAAAIWFVLTETIKKTGHSFLKLNETVHLVARLLNLPKPYLEASVLADPRLVVEEDRVYLPVYYEAEKTVARRLADQLRLGERDFPGLDQRLRAVEKELGLRFAPEQAAAIAAACRRPVTVITGAAGTGKSTLCRGLLKVLDSYGESYACAAPTGKAAYKLKTLTGAPAATLHRLLRCIPGKGFLVNEKNPLRVGYLIIDEASMLDLLLLKAVLLGISAQTRLVFIGDPYQLPPVEAGTTLQPLLGSYAIAPVVLPTIFRQQRDSTILRNAGMVNLEQPFPLDRADDFVFHDVERPQEMVRALFAALDELAAQGYDPVREVNVLTPLNTGGGEISVASLNHRLREKLNPATPANSFLVFDREFRLGDKVMQRKNDYGLDLFNGDIGYIVANHPETQEVELEFYGERKRIPYAAMEAVVLNYAMTVHKSQGSESRAVIFLATKSGCFFLLNKNLFYTAMTRAREKLVMIMPAEVVRLAVRFNVHRQSHLAARLQQLVIGREPAG